MTRLLDFKSAETEGCHAHAEGHPLSRMAHSQPLAIDLFCGLFGWSAGLIAEGWEIVGFDIEDMHAKFELERAPECRLVIQDVTTLHGSQFRNAALIVASPPCQAYSYRAMPWKRAKALPPPDNTLFETCFRIQREACIAAGRHIPLVVENVRGAQKWVGRARWNYGSFYLWGDVPALMPMTPGRAVMKNGVAHRANGETNFHASAARAEGQKSFQSESVDRAYKSSGMNWSDPTKRGQDFTRIAGEQSIKNNGGPWFNVGSPGQKETGRNPVHDLSGIKGVPHARKFASAMIARIPEPLARHIAKVYYPC